MLLQMIIVRLKLVIVVHDYGVNRRILAKHQVTVVTGPFLEMVATVRLSNHNNPLSKHAGYGYLFFRVHSVDSTYGPHDHLAVVRALHL